MGRWADGQPGCGSQKDLAVIHWQRGFIPPGGSMYRWIRAPACWLPLLAACSIAKGSGESADGGTRRTYYIAADELPWDYAPADSNLITGKPWSEIDKFSV